MAVLNNPLVTITNRFIFLIFDHHTPVYSRDLRNVIIKYIYIKGQRDRLRSAEAYKNIIGFTVM